MSYKSVNEVHTLGFDDCEVQNITVNENYIEIELEALIIRANNSKNENFTDSYADTTEGTTKAAYVADTVTAGYSWQDSSDNNKTKAPIQFRVLHTTSNGYAKDDTNKNRVPALFMLTEYAIGQRRWDTCPKYT